MDVVARLQLRAEQFSSETGRAFAEMKTRAASTASEIKGTFTTAFADVSRIASDALTLKRSSTGSLDLSPEIRSLTAAATAAEQHAQALTELSIAQSAAAAKGGAYAEAMKLDADAAAVAALNEERNAQAIRAKIAILETYQQELNQTVSLTDRHTAAQAKNAISAGQMRSAMQQVSFQIGDIAQGYAAGTPAATIFAQQSGQLIQAFQLMIPAGEGALGVIAGFAPWVGAAMVVLTPFVAKLFESGDAIEKEVDKLKKDSQETEINRQARERFNDTLDGQIAKWKELNDEIQKSILTQQQQEYGKFAELNTALNKFYADRIKFTNDLTRAQGDLNTATAQYSKYLKDVQSGAIAADDGGVGNGLRAAVNAARARVTQIQSDLDRTKAKIAPAENAVRAAQTPLLERGVTTSIDAATAATERYTFALGQLRQEFAKGAISQTQFDAGVRKVQIERDRDLKKARDDKAEADRLAKQGPLTSFLAPVTGPITSPFGAKRSYETHPGVDIAVPVGTPVRAPAGGTVDAAALMGKLGNTIVINFGGGTTGRFGHLEKFNVKPGDTVNAGDIIGYSGGAKGAEGAGNSTGPHLHYEIRRNGKLVNPMAGRFPTDSGAAADDAAKRQAIAQRNADQLVEAQRRAADTVLSISAAWDKQPTLIDRARVETNKLNEIIEKYKGNTDAASAAIVANAEAAKKTIAEGINRPFEDYMRNQRESLATQQLVLEGRDAEAQALQDAVRLQATQGSLTKDQLADVLATAQAQERIARAIEDQRRLVSIYTGFVGDLQRDFGQFEKDLETKGLAAFPRLIGNAFESYKQMGRDLISNMIFGGIERDVETYVRKMTGQRTPAEIISDDATDAGRVIKTSFNDVGDSAAGLADALRRVTGQIATDVPAGLGGGTSGTGDGPITSLVTNMEQFLNEGLKGLTAANDNSKSGAGQAGDIIVSATRSLDKSTGVFGIIVDDLARNLKNLGITLPKALTDGIKKIAPDLAKGAAIGQVGGSVFASITGGKNDSTASAIGGALGQVAGKALGSVLGVAGNVAGPIGAVVGGILGNVVSGLFQKVPKGQAGVTVNQYGEVKGGTATGTTADARAGAASLAGGVSNALQQIADMLGAKVTGSTDVQIGTYKGEIRVNDHGGAIGGVKGSGAISFGSEQDAIAYAVSDALKDGVLSGISQASLKILQSGQDLNKAIQKALSIEAIPHDLKAMLDPVGGAIDDLNKKWKATVDALKEGGASSEQFAQAQQLYELQLAQVKTQTASASQSLKDFLNSLKVGSNSPYSLRDQEATAKAQLQPFLDAIAGGQSIDQSKYQDAAKAYLDVERQIYGSTQQYFDAMDAIQAATSKAIAAIDNAVPITPGIPDPFTKATADSTAKTADGVQTGNEIAAQNSDLLAHAVGLLTQIVNGGGGSLGGFIGQPRAFSNVGAL